MKISVIHSIYAPYVRGGAEVVVDTVVSGLMTHGEDVFVISVGYQDGVEDVDGVRVHRIKPRNIFNFLDIAHQPIWRRFVWHVLDMFNVGQAVRVYCILRDEAPDLVLTHSLKGLGYVIPIAIRLLRIRHIHTVHDMQLLSPTGLLPIQSFSFFEVMYQMVCRLAFIFVQIVIVPSQYMKEVYSRRGFFAHACVHIIPNPVVHVESAGTTRTKGGPLRLVYVGQVEEYKGIVTLLNAMRDLPGDWQLQIVGDGTAMSLVRRVIRNMAHITCLGRLSTLELRESVWPVVDLLVHPSHTPESFGMNVVEAYSFGVPALVSHMGALPELVHEGETGWICPACDVASLRSILIDLVEHPERVRALRSACLEESRRYSVDHYIHALFSV